MLTLTREICSPQGAILWDGTGFTQYGEAVYTAGDCWALAWHIARLLEPTHGKGNLFTTGRRDRWNHVVVRVSEDLYLDAHGLSSSEELEARWEAKLFPIKPRFEASVGAYQAWLDVDFVFPSGHPEANKVALALLDAHGF